MVFQFSSFLGRAVSSNNVQTPLFPVSPLPLEKREISKITYDPRYTLPTIKKDQIIRNSSSGPRPGFSPLPENIRKAQELFQRPNNIPVYIKAGTRDKVLVGITFFLIFVGAIQSAHSIYLLATKK